MVAGVQWRYHGSICRMISARKLPGKNSLNKTTLAFQLTLRFTWGLYLEKRSASDTFRYVP